MSFQAESKKSGDEFEAQVLLDLKARGFYRIDKNIVIDEVGCEVDFLARKPGFTPTNPGRPTYLKTEYVEAKGGREDAGKRPGAQRTDNVKKAIANAALIKAKFPGIYFVVYFSAKPITGSSSAKMIDTALCHNIIDEVRYITNRDLIDTQLDLFSMEQSELEK